MVKAEQHKVDVQIFELLMFIFEMNKVQMFEFEFEMSECGNA